MKFIDEFRDGALARKLLDSLRGKVPDRPLRFMEVCGTHTVSIFRNGLRDALPPQIALLSGPGCPVCVTSQEDIDKAVELARISGVILATYGDMLKVPGTRSSLQAERARGADIRVLYSPSDTLTISQQNPTKKVVFLGVGFETTAPAISLVIAEAARLKIDNVFVLSVHKLIPPSLKALAAGAEITLDGFLLPGHVSTIIGSRPYGFLASEYNLPAVVSGFEPLDILQSIHMLVAQILARRAAVEIQYKRVVREEGNARAQQAVDEVFGAADAGWRGLGRIPASGLKLRDAYSRFDAEKAFQLDVGYSREPAGCRCGDILRGAQSPHDCRLFAKVCTPDHPAGPCMVSSEGTCAAYYQYAERPPSAVTG